MCVLLITRLLGWGGGDLARKPVNHTSWMIVVTPSDRPKSVCTRCVIDLFGDVFVLSCCLFDIFVGIRAVVIGLSHIFIFFAFAVLSLKM